MTGPAEPDRGAAGWPRSRPGRSPRRGRRPRRAASAVLARVLAAPFALDNPASQQTRRLGVLAVLTGCGPSPATAGSSGGWPAAPRTSRTGGTVAAGRPAGRAAARTPLPHLSPGLLVLICADVIRPEPGLAAAVRPGAARPGRRDGPHPRPGRVRRARRVVSARAGSDCRAGQQALTRIAVIMAAKGGPVADSHRRRLRRAARRSPPASAPRRRRHAAQPAVLPAAARARRASARTRPPRSRCSPAAGSRAASS